MDVKLTLRLDKDIIEDAKKYARDKNTSLSSIVEWFFKSLVAKRNNPPENYTPLVKELSGIIQLPPDFDLKTDYTDYLMEKYK